MMRSFRTTWACVFLVPLFWAGTATAQSSQVDEQPNRSSGHGLDPSDAAWSSVDFWETVDGKPVEESWDFEEGQIKLARPRGAGGSLLSPPLPSSFELSFEWKIDERSNTGIKYRVRRYGNRLLGVEYQIIDPDIAAEGKGATASIYDLVAPSRDATLNPPGQWNKSRIVAAGHHLQHYLNGKLVAQTQTRGVPWEVEFAKSKFWGNQGFATPQQDDRFMITDHHGQAVYRNFKFAPREPVRLASVARNPPFLGNAMRNSWADQNSIVLWTRTTAIPEMVTGGREFRDLSKQEASKLAGSDDAERMLNIQLPEDATLKEMLGACPGAPGEVRLTYFPVRQRKSAIQTAWIETLAETDFTAQWKLQDLKPGREYAAVIEARPVGQQKPTAVVRGGFQTAPPVDAEQDLRFCMTTCHDFIRRDDGMNGHRIYPAMSAIDPAFVVHAGDIEYYDKPAPWALTIELMRFKWGRIFALPNNRAFYQRTTSYFLKDDHDTLKNDCWVGQNYGAVTFTEGQRIFNQEQFPSHPSRYKTVRWGRDLQIWLLEGRDYRSPNTMPDGPEKTILGAQQKAWLKQTLSDSDAAFKLVFSPTPIVGPDRANKKDNHANETFQHEGDELRREFSKHDGVIVLCGDRHWQYASKDATSGLWEFGCGPGSEEHQLGWKKGDQRPSHEFLRVAGGFLSGSLAYDDQNDGAASLTLRHRTVDGEAVSEFVFPASFRNEREERTAD